MRVNPIAAICLAFVAVSAFGEDEMNRLWLKGLQETSSGDFAAASQDLNAALTKARQAKDFGRQYTYSQSLSHLSEQQHDLPQAEAYLKSGVAALVASHKISPLPALGDLGFFYKRHQMNDEEIQNLEQIVEVWKAFAGADSLGTARYEYDLGAALAAGGKDEQAEAQLRLALAVYQKSGPTFSLATDKAKRSLIEVLSAEGKNDEAEQMKATLTPATSKLPRPDKTPRLIAKKEPEYTDAAKKLKVSGTVVLSLDIDQTGHPLNVQVVEPLGEGLDEKAINAVSEWQFEPAQTGGVPVMAHAVVEVNFRLLQ